MSRIVLLGFMFWVQFSAAAPNKNFTLVHYGNIGTTEGGESFVTKEFRLAYGDTSAQDAVANSPGRSNFGPFAMNAAFYYHNADGSWNLFNFRLPSESLTDPHAIVERASFLEFLGRPEVRELMGEPYTKTNFGKQTDFIYKRMELKTTELPEPFRHLPKPVLDTVESIFQYNVDGTAKIFLRKDFDLDGNAQGIFNYLMRTETLVAESM